MQYQRSHDIERRLLAVLALVRTGQHSTREIAEKLGVSVPTVSRDVTALRERGHSIKAEKQADGWAYRLEIPLKLARRPVTLTSHQR